jgi:hypothetical protein
MEYGPNDRFEYASRFGYGKPMFSCHDCAYYNFENEAAMLNHCRKTGHGLVKEPPTNEQFVASQLLVDDRPRVIITLGYLCWNTRQASVEGVEALIQEAGYLHSLGCTPNIVIMDNGSSDGTGQAISELLDLSHSDLHIELHILAENEGISRARNRIIESALTLNSQYLMLMDGDIEIVPLSSYTMARYLHCHPDLGCIGAYSSNYTVDREKAAKYLHEIPENYVRGDIRCAWTQYGLFRCSMFQQGIRFDETGPFGQPGWGFEDDDLCFQMLEKGWGNWYFGRMCYLHRNIRSSWPNLRDSGVDPQKAFQRRKEYLLEKWSKRQFDSGIIHSVRGQHAPVFA